MTKKKITAAHSRFARCASRFFDATFHNLAPLDGIRKAIIDDNERCTGTLNIISINRNVLVGIPTWPGLLLEDNRSARTVGHAIEIRKQFCRMFLWRILSGKAWLYGPRTWLFGTLSSICIKAKRNSCPVLSRRISIQILQSLSSHNLHFGRPTSSFHWDIPNLVRDFQTIWHRCCSENRCCDMTIGIIIYVYCSWIGNLPSWFTPL